MSPDNQGTGVRWEIGARIERPEDFRATGTRLTRTHTHFLDTERGYLMRVARDRNDLAPTAYYELLAIVDAPMIRPRRKLRLNSPFRRFRWIGVVKFALIGLVTASSMLVLYPLYPSVQYSVSSNVRKALNDTNASAATVTQPSPRNRLVIPKIGVETDILGGPTLDILDKKDGVWHQTGAVKEGNVVLAGHRFKYLPPNTATLYNLDKLTAGDTIVMDFDSRRYVYVVDKLETVNATQVSILEQSGGPRLTIYTCTNASQTKRTVVYAHLQP